MAPFVGFFDLSRLCTNNVSDLSAACDELASLVKKSIGRKDEERTSGTKNHVQIIRYAVSHYLKLNDVNPHDVLKRLMKASIPKQGIASKITQNMQVKTLPLEIYQKYYSKLCSKPSEKNIALLLMLFLSLSAEEVCGLNLEDIQPITGYRGCYHFQIIHRYIKKSGKYFLDTFESADKYRYIPIPTAIFRIISPLLKVRTDNKLDIPLFTANGRRLNPAQITDALEVLLSSADNKITVVYKNRKNYINLSFKPSSYRLSCRAYWHYQCGLSDGEIWYLSGLKAQDTVSSHYIDFTNASMQYRMLMQLNYGVDMLGANSEPPVYVQPLYINKQKVSGRLTTRAGIEFSVLSPVQLSLKSKRGIVIAEGDAVPCIKI